MKAQLSLEKQIIATDAVSFCHQKKDLQERPLNVQDDYPQAWTGTTFKSFLRLLINVILALKTS